MQSYELSGIRIVELDAAGFLLDSEAAALDVMGETYGTGADMVAIPVSRLAPEFLDLRSGMLGAVIQKFTNYQLRIAFLGDISEAIAASNALRDFVRETRRGSAIVFASDRAELAVLLA